MSTFSLGDGVSENCARDAVKLLRERGFPVDRVIRILSAGESGFGLEAALYINANGRARTATFRFDPEQKRVVVNVQPGFPVP